MDKSGQNHTPIQFVEPVGSTQQQGLAPLFSCGRQFMTSGQNWICPMPPHLPAALEMVDKTVFRFVHRLPISTCENAKVDKSGRFFRIFYFFFYFFSYTPFYLLLCYYPFLPKHPVLSAIMRFFHFFWPLFYTFLHLFAPLQSLTTKANLLTSRLSSPPHVKTQSRNPPPARTRGHRRPPLTSFIRILGLTCERPLHLPKMGFWVCVYRYWKNSSLFPIIRPRLRHDLQMQSFHAV